jgi:hypothetical protein
MSATVECKQINECESTSSLSCFLDREFSCRIGLEAFVGDPKAASHGSTVGAAAKAGLGPFDGTQPVTQAGCDRVVRLLCRKSLGGICHVAGLVGCASILLPRFDSFLKKLLDSPTLGCE